MRKWQEYGFPDLIGVPFQVALEGLIRALRERLYAETINSSYAEWNLFKAFEDGEIYPIRQAVQEFESLLDILKNSFYLPDEQHFSLENAAAYLGEELIQDVSRRDIVPYVGYEWLLQRYRILNLAHTTYANSVHVYSQTASWEGSGDSFSEAERDIEEDWKENDSWSFSAYCSFARYSSGCRIEKYMSAPLKVDYRLNTPGVLFLRGTPYMTIYERGHEPWPNNEKNFVIDREEDYHKQWQWHDMGTGFPFGVRQTCYSFQVPDDTEKGDIIYMSERGGPLYEYVKNFPRPSLPQGYDHSQKILGFYISGSWYCDFRPFLKFYDPVEKSSK